jgi:2-hydroxy-6-oxonona-2,4-dienedioate hydrolase
MTKSEMDEHRSVWRYLMTATFRQDFVDAGGLRTRYLQAGNPDNPPLLLLHGTGGHWEAFCANIKPLSEHFNCFAPDLMGCGFTDKPDTPYEIADYIAHLLAFMDKLKIHRASFIGVSLGSWIIARLAQQHPSRVDKAILVSPSGYKMLPAESATIAVDRRASGLDPSWDNVKKVISALFFDKQKVMDDLIAVRQAVYSLPGMDKLMNRNLTLIVDRELRAKNNLTEAEWRGIKAPILVVAHVDTKDFWLETAYDVIKLLPNGTLTEIKQTGHWSQLEQSDEFNRVALEFLTSGH